MTELKSKMDNLFVACWKDEALKGRLLSDPQAVLADEELSDVAGGSCSAWMWTSFMGTSKICEKGWDAGMPGR